MAGRVHQREILDNREFLIHNLQEKIKDVLVSLVEHHVLSENDRESLKTMYTRPEDQVKALCDHYLYRSGSKDWLIFLRILKHLELQNVLDKLQRKVTLSSGKKNLILGEANVVTRGDDALDHAIYAECIAELLTDRNTTFPISIGVYGNWGSGKSALLGLIEEELTSQAKLQNLPHGWLWRNGDRYWCIIRNGQLHFSNKEYDIENSCVVMLRGKRCIRRGHELEITLGTPTEENQPDSYIFEASSNKESNRWFMAIDEASKTTRQALHSGEFKMSREPTARTYWYEIHGDTLYYSFSEDYKTLRVPMLLPGKQIKMHKLGDRRCEFELLSGNGRFLILDDGLDLYNLISTIIKRDQDMSKSGTSKQQGASGKHCDALLVISSVLTVILSIGISILFQQLHASGFFSALKFMFKTWHHLVKTPVQDKSKSEKRPRCLIPVRFNSWEYAGCSKLWAGIVVRLCDAVEDHFGRWTVFYYRIMDDVLQQISNSTCFSGFCIVLSQVMLMLSLILPIICIAIYFGITNSCGLPDLFISIALFIPTTLASVKLLFQMHKLGVPYSNFVKALTKKLGKPKFDEELGYMHAVKKEVLLINRLVSYMSMLGDLNYIPVIFVDDLDRCDPTKVKTMFEALHIMFNDPNLKFYSIVAVEQRSLCNALNTPVSSEETSNSSIMSAMGYLRKIIHLPICLPPGNNVTTQKFLKMVCPAASTSLNSNDANEDQNDNNANGNRAHMENIENVAIRGQNNQNNRQPELINVDFESTFDKCISLLHKSPNHIHSNPRHLKRIGNICNIACRLIFKTEPKFFNKKLVLFLLMAEQWPVRTSAFLYQAFETDNGEYKISDNTHLKDDNPRFKELLKLPQIISDLINFDDCPNEFKGFLEKYKLTFQDLRTFKPYIINLAGYIQELIAKADEIKRLQ